LDPFWIIGV